MKIFAVDANNDLYLGSNGKMAVATDVQAFSQACEHALKSILNEMVFCSNRGLPYFEAIWSDTEDARAFEDRARGTLTSIPGAIRVTEFTTEVEDGTLRYHATISSEYGATSINGEAH